jgi:hypothetical protein
VLVAIVPTTEFVCSNDRSVNFYKFAELPERLSNSFHNWLQHAESVLLRAMDHAVKSRA